jgi:ELWxxDGT repeat protein
MFVTSGRKRSKTTQAARRSRAPRHSGHGRGLRFEGLEERRVLSATAAPELLLDIDTISTEWESGAQGTFSSEPYFLAVLEGDAYFYTPGPRYHVGPSGGYDQVSAGGIWKTDGTAAGTVHLDLVELADEADPGLALYPPGIVFNDEIYAVGSFTSGLELWKTDGTASGTMELADIWPGLGSSNPGEFLEFNNELYFTADDGANRLVWKTDGSPERTVRAALHPDGVSADVEILGVFDNELYFTAPADGGIGWELWKTVGTATSAVLVAEIDAASFSPLTIFKNELYFYVDDGTTIDFLPTPALWKIDLMTGSEVPVNSGSGLLRDILFVLQPTIFNDELYFRATDGETGFELWKTDGTTAGTVRLGDINPGFGSSFPRELTVFQNKLYFGASVGQEEWQARLGANELWKTDGTPTGTLQLAPNWASGLTVFNDALYFVAPADSVPEMWKTDGNANGTERLTFFGQNPYFSPDGPILKGVLPGLLPAGNFALFSASDGYYGMEPWIIRAVAPEVTPENLAQVIAELPAGSTQIEAAPTPSNLNDFLSAIAALPANGGEVIDIVLNLSEGDYEGATIDVPAGYRVVINGEAGQVVFHGASPSLTLQSGDVRVTGVTLVNSTDAASIVVNGGSLAVRDSVVRETTGGSQAAFEIHGGSVDLGTLADPGGNTLEVSGPGELVRNFTGSSVPTFGNEYVLNGVPLSSEVAAVPEWMRLVVDGSSMRLVGAFPLTITVNSATWEIGTPFPTFTASYSGFVHADDPSVLAGVLEFTTEANATSRVGNYTVAAAGLTSNKYDITYAPGMLEVKPAQVDIDLRPASINIDQNGAISLVIFGSSTFNASQISLGSLAFAGVSIDVFNNALVDADQDGSLDLLVHFKASDALKTALTDLYSELLLEDYDDDEDYSNKQLALIAIDGAFGEFDQEFQGSDTTNLFLAGNSLKTLLEELQIPS